MPTMCNHFASPYSYITQIIWVGGAYVKILLLEEKLANACLVIVTPPLWKLHFW